AEPACAERMSLTRVSSSRRKFLPAANCGSDSVGLINSKFVQHRYPWSEPNCVTRSVSRAGSNSHTVAVRDGCTTIPLALRQWLRRTRPFLCSAASHTGFRFVHLDPPGWIKSWRFENLSNVFRQADFITAPSITTPVA